MSIVSSVQIIIFVAVSVTFGEDANPSTCVFDDGQEYETGENVGDSFVTRCGDPSDWPCFCDPQATFMTFCPYCGFSDGDGTLHCGRDGETISFQDGSIVRACSCAFDPQDPRAAPVRNCTIEGEDTPVSAPSIGPPSSSVDGRCTLSDAEGITVEFENGESFGDLIEGACGPASEWPSFCRVLDEQGEFDIFYPYCVFNDVSFEESDNGILCAQDGEGISYTSDNGVAQNCTCSITPEGVSEIECGESPSVESETNGPVSAPSSLPPQPEPQGTFQPTSSCAVYIEQLSITMSFGPVVVSVFYIFLI